VLDAVLVAGDEAAADPAVVEVLAPIVEQVRAAVQPLVDLLHDRAVVAEPDRPGEHQDVGGLHHLEDLRPVVGLPPVLAHVWPDPGGDVVVDGTDDLDLHAVGLHDVAAEVDKALGVARLG
jgi:hypothetical protein